MISVPEAATLPITGRPVAAENASMKLGREAVGVRRKRPLGDDAHHLPVARGRVHAEAALGQPAVDGRGVAARRAAAQRHDVAEPERLHGRHLEAAHGLGDVRERRRSGGAEVGRVGQVARPDGVQHDHACPWHRRTLSPGRVRLRAGVGLEVGLAHVVGRDVRVHLGRLDAGVAEHLLHAAQVAAALEQVGGERVAQGVRRDVLVDAGVAGVVADELEDGLAGDALAAVVQEEDVAALEPAQVRPAALQVDAGRPRSSSCPSAPCAASRPCRCSARRPRPGRCRTRAATRARRRAGRRRRGARASPGRAVRAATCRAGSRSPRPRPSSAGRAGCARAAAAAPCGPRRPCRPRGRGA